MAKVKEFMQLPTDLLYRILDTTIQKAHCNEHNMRTIDIAAALKATLVSKAFYEYIISQLRLALNRKFAIHEKISTSIPSGRCICFERISLVTEQRTKEAVELLVWFKVGLYPLSILTRMLI